MRFAQLLTGPMRPRPIDQYKAEPYFYQPAAIRSLPAIVRDLLVGISHAVSVLTLANGGAAVFGSLQQFRREPVRHGLLAAGTCRLDNPAHGQGLTPVGAHLDRHL